MLKRRLEVSTVAGGCQTPPIVVADADRPLVVELLKYLNRLKYVFPAHGVLAVEVLAHSQNFGHLAETNVKLVHFFVRLLEAFKKVLALKIDPFYLVVGLPVFFYLFD